MSDPVEDGVTLLRRWLGLCHTGWSNDELRMIVGNIIAPAVQAAERRGMEIADARRALRAPADTAWWEARVAKAVQAERERIKTAVLVEGHGDGCLTPYMLIDGCLCGLGSAVRAIDVLAVIDGKENNDVLGRT